MSLATSYGFLILAVILGVTSNSFAKSAEGFKADDELHKERAAAGVDLAKAVTTPMGDDFLEQYKG